MERQIDMSVSVWRAIDTSVNNMSRESVLQLSENDGYLYISKTTQPHHMCMLKPEDFLVLRSLDFLSQ